MDRFPALLMMLANRWTRGLAGWAIASMVIWYLFPLYPPLRSPLPRIIAIIAALVICAGINAALSWRRRRREQVLAAAMTGDTGRDGREVEAEAAEEVARLRERMKQALFRLGRRGYGRHVYDLPWFVLIGPPGSGKTTALLNSGLHFPFARDEADPAIGGVGGTRLCDWWFADEAVLIDTAGRYTTQDSDAAVDQAGWHGFLDLLRRGRPRQPINGVVVVLSLVELTLAEASERAAQARSVRRRINEITDRLQLRVPVYVVFSKADQLRGFDAYFADLDAAARSQVWGMTFPLDAGVGRFDQEFRRILGRLEERLVERLQAERSAERRALIGGFPLQVASLAQPLSEFLSQAFVGSRLDPPPLLRGVYLTSATQEGTPIDRLTGMLARSFGVDQQRVPSLRPVNGRSYFVTRLLRDVILGEALLVASPPGRMLRRRLWRALGFSTVGLAAIAGAVLLWRADVDGRIAVERADEGLAAYRQALAEIKLDPVADDDVEHVDPLLNAAAALPQDDGGWAPRLLGLSQQAKLAQSDHLVYENSLQRVLLPRLIRRLETQMRGRFDDPDFLYQATRVYLMLGGAGPLDPNLVRAWMTADWKARYPGALNAALRASLLVHLNALLAAPLPPVSLDGSLVEAARATFSRVTLAERVYSRIRAESAPALVRDWTPADAIGPAEAQMFTRLSRQPLTEGVPGFFTDAGFHGVLLHNLAATTRAVAQESWVLGHAEQIPTEGPQVEGLEEAVLSLYFADAEKHWDALLDDLALAPFGSNRTLIQDLYVLSSPQSPMRDLLTSIAHALRFEVMAAADGANKPGAAQENHLAALFAATPANAASAPSAGLRGFEAHYQPLLDLAGSGGHAPIENVLHLINTLQQELAAVAPGAPAVPETLRDGGDPVQLLLAEAERQPLPVSRWLRQIAASGNVMLGKAAQSSASAAFADSDGPRQLCRAVVDGHYPFDPASSEDAPIDDFARLFAPGGLLDAYYQTQIKPFVDTRGAVWQPHSLGGVPAPMDAATVASFQRIATIRDMFFPLGGMQPRLRFTLTPDPDSGSDVPAILTLGASSIRTDTGHSTSFTWPGADGMSDAELKFDSKDGPAAGLQAQGPWALFRLLASARLRPQALQDTYALVFVVGGHRADFTLQAGSSHNPFGQAMLAGFHCPSIR